MIEIRTKLLRILFFSELHGVRFLLFLAEIFWGLLLLHPSDTFDRPVYAVMANIMPEELWGCLFIFSAIGQGYILYRQDYHDKVAVTFAAYNSILWLFVIISIFQSVEYDPAAMSGEFALTLGASWVFIRSGMPRLDRRKYCRRKTDVT